MEFQNSENIEPREGKSWYGIIEQYLFSRLFIETFTILASCVSWFWLQLFGLSSVGSVFPSFSLLLNSSLDSPSTISGVPLILLLLLNDGGLLPLGPLTRVLLIFCSFSSLSSTIWTRSVNQWKTVCTHSYLHIIAHYLHHQVFVYSENFMTTIGNADNTGNILVRITEWLLLTFDSWVNIYFATDRPLLSTDTDSRLW